MLHATSTSLPCPFRITVKRQCHCGGLQGGESPGLFPRYISAALSEVHEPPLEELAVADEAILIRVNKADG